MNRFVFAIMAIVFVAIDASAQAPPKHQLDRIEDNQQELLRKADEQIKLQKETHKRLSIFEKNNAKAQALILAEQKKTNALLADANVTLGKVFVVVNENQALLGKALSKQDEILFGLDKTAKAIRALEDGQDSLRRQVRELASRPPETRTVYVREPVIYYYPVERTYYVNVGYNYYRYYSYYDNWGNYRYGWIAA